MLTQLDPPIWLYVPKRSESGLAHAVIDRGPEDSLYWVVFMDSGPVIEVMNEEVRAHRNATLRRGASVADIPPAPPAAQSRS